MPCYNEIQTVEECIKVVLESPWVGELIVVDDGSTDGTRDILASLNFDRLRVILQKTNSGKGSALRTGFMTATFPYVIVQDADLEYDPADYEKILKPLIAGKADAVFGSRFKGGDANRVLYFWHSLGNKLLTFISNMFTNYNLTDMETCYKCFRLEIIQNLSLQENRFGIEPELTGRLAAKRLRLYEVGISYAGRTYEDGKKIGWKDGIRAVYCIIKYSPMLLKSESEKH